MFFSQFDWSYWVWGRKTTAGKCHSHHSSGQHASARHCCWCYLLAKAEAVVLLFSFCSFPFPSISLSLPPPISVSLTFSSTSLLSAQPWNQPFSKKPWLRVLEKADRDQHQCPRCAQCSCGTLAAWPWQLTG